MDTKDIKENIIKVLSLKSLMSFMSYVWPVVNYYEFHFH